MPGPQGEVGPTGSSFTTSLIFTPDNVLDIGAAGVTRARNLYLAGAATVGGNLTVGGSVGFYGVLPQAKQTVTGIRAGNTALTSLLLALANIGLITDSSTNA